MDSVSLSPAHQAAGHSIKFANLCVSVLSTNHSANHSASQSTAQTPYASKRRILNGATGVIRAGSLCAILGPSGAAKTTLLDCLAGRKRGSINQSINPSTNPSINVTGAILIADKARDNDWYSEHVAFVPQQSVLLPALTPRETIAFASRMRSTNPSADPKINDKHHEDNTNRVLSALHLNKCADSRIGDDLTGGLSGGEKRRVNVAIELVAKPSIILMDEPTTGLDSNTALKLMRSIKAMTNLGQSHKSVGSQLVTQPITQPIKTKSHFDYEVKHRAEDRERFDMYESGNERQFHQYASVNPSQSVNPAINRTGKLVRFADGVELQAIDDVTFDSSMTPINHSAHHLSSSDPLVTAVVTIHQPNSEIFELIDDLVLMSAGQVIFCGPADDALEYFSALGYECPLHTNPPEFYLDLLQTQTLEDRERVQTLAEAYQIHLMGKQATDPLWRPVSLIPSHVNDVAPASRLPWSLQFKYLFGRAERCSSRSPLLKLAQVLQSVVLGIIVVLVYAQFSMGQTSVQNRMGAIYFMVLCIVFACTFAVVLTFAEERAVFMREQAINLYSVPLYFLARTTVDVLPTLGTSVVFSCIVYFGCGFVLSFTKFLFFTLIITLVSYTGQSIGLLVGCLVPTRLLAMILTPMAIAPFILFTAYAMPYPDSIPNYFAPFQYGSPFWFSFSALVANEFPGLLFDCKESEKVQLPMMGGLNLPAVCPYRTGNDVLVHYNIDGSGTQQGNRVIALIVQSIVYRILALSALTYFARSNRK